MKSLGLPAVTAGLVVALGSGVVLHAQAPPRNPERERLVERQLEAVSPGAVPDFRRATAAMDRGDYATAIPLFGRTLLRAPEFSPASRRLGFSLMHSGKGPEGLRYLERAVSQERSLENLATLAEALAFPGPGIQVLPAVKERALGLAQEASRTAKDGDPDYLFLMANLALTLNRVDVLRATESALVARYPNLAPTHFVAAILAASESEWVKADREATTAERLGMPHQEVQAFLDSGVRSRARLWRAVYGVATALWCWAGGLTLLFAAGGMLSSATLRSLAQAQANRGTAPAEARLRRLYRGVIRVASVYYYLSMPFVAILVLGLAGTVLYGFLRLGRIPLQLVLALVIGAVITVYKMVQSLFIRVQSIDPGRGLTHEDAPGLWELTRQVAVDVGTRPIDEIRVTPGTDMAVYERGTARQRKHDEATRVLIVGVGLLNGFHQGAFRAVLAHEYGHFSHRDTAGGDVALRVRQDMTKLAVAMMRARQNVWWNLAFQFLRLYDRLYRRISHGATRLQEVLADRVAAGLYGAAYFEEGLRHVIRRAIEFEVSADDEIRKAVYAKRPIQNLYMLPAPAPVDIDGRFEDALAHETTADDTHPAPRDRFRMVGGITCSVPIEGRELVWDLIRDRNALTGEMTALIAQQVQPAS